MSPLEHAQDLARHLSAPPTHDEVLALADAITSAFAERQAPGRATAMFVRHHLGTRPPEVQRAVRDAAQRARERGPRLAATQQPDEFVSIRVAAARLDVHESTIRRWLRQYDGRRSLGWPLHVGAGAFRIPAPAVSGATRAAFIAQLPVLEPQHHLAPLPDNYELALGRVGDPFAHPGEA